MKLDIAQLDRVQLQVAAATCLVAMGLAYGAITTTLHAVHVRAEIAAQGGKSLPKVERTSTPLPEPEVNNIIKRLSVLHPEVKIVANGTGIVQIAVPGAAQYSEWRAAIADLLQSGGRETVIETVSICGAACSGSYCVAEFSLKNTHYAVT